MAVAIWGTPHGQFGKTSRFGLGLSRSHGFWSMVRVASLVFLPVATFVTHAAIAGSCVPREFTTMELPDTVGQADWQAALLAAYPGLHHGDDADTLLTGEGIAIAVAGPTNRSATDLLNDPTVGDQFAYIYDLRPVLTARNTPFHDAGRIRNDAFFRLLYYDDPASAQAGMVSVSAGALGPARFQVTDRQGVSCQLGAALAVLAAEPAGLAPIFTSVGGGFNWRAIAGTDRLSPHSFGIAIDVNAELGQYWKWTGATEGQVGAYDNRLPWRLIETMERFGFIWGGKWHHFDGMHFEYRPELIIFSRMQDVT